MEYQTQPVAGVGTAVCTANLACELRQPGSPSRHSVVPRSQTAMDCPFARRIVLEPGDAGCNHRSLPPEWIAPDPAASLLAVLHSAIGAYSVDDHGRNQSPIRSASGSARVLSGTGGCGTRAATTLACAGKPLRWAGMGYASLAQYQCSLGHRQHTQSFTRATPPCARQKYLPV